MTLLAIQQGQDIGAAQSLGFFGLSGSGTPHALAKSRMAVSIVAVRLSPRATAAASQRSTAVGLSLTHFISLGCMVRFAVSFFLSMYFIMIYMVPCSVLQNDIQYK